MPLPLPELYERFSAGEAPRAVEKGSGSANEVVPLTAFTENFSSIPLIAPPPFGSDSEGMSMAFDLLLPPCDLRNEAAWFLFSGAFTRHFLVMVRRNYWRHADSTLVEKDLNLLRLTLAFV